MSEDAKTDKTTLLLRDVFVLEGDLLFRIGVPRKKRLARLKLLVKRLCVPKRFRHEIVRYSHNNNGHYAAQSLFLTLSSKYYWKSLYTDVVEFCKTCDVCQRTKVNFAHRYVPLNPVPVPPEVGYRFCMDHKTLTRKTDAGNTAILVLVDSFSNYPHLIPVPDLTAETTAKAIVHHIIPIHGIFKELQSDRGPAFTSALFSHINKLLGIRHVTSASLTARSNGQAEATVKRLVEHLRIYGTTDKSIEDLIPIIEMSMRATPHSKLGISPHEILFGRQMRLGIPCDPQPTPPELSTDKIAYFQWLATELRRLHAAVKSEREDQKLIDKATYDKSKKAIEPTWKVGDLVLLEDDRVKPGSDIVVTRKRFHGSYIIRQVVQNNPQIGRAYQLVHEYTGKLMRNLVTSDRLKAYDVNRESFTRRLPRLMLDVQGPRDAGDPSVQLRKQAQRHKTHRSRAMRTRQNLHRLR